MKSLILTNRIGYGTWPLAGNVNGTLSYGVTNDEESVKSLNRALELGITFFDTSDLYGYGHVETMLGNVIHDIRTKVQIATKGGFVNTTGVQNFDPDHLKKSLFASLDRLRTDYVDMYLLHNPSLSVLKNENIINTLETLVSNNHIKQYGISLISPADGIVAINEYGFRIIEVNYNILDHRADTCGLLDLCKQKDVFVIIKTPLAQGLLGNFTFNSDVTDIRNSWKKDKVDRLTSVYKKMLSCLNPNPYTNAQNCLRFCLTNNAISVTIPGMKVATEVDENANVSNLPVLSHEEIVKIQEIYKTEIYD